MGKQRTFLLPSFLRIFLDFDLDRMTSIQVFRLHARLILLCWKISPYSYTSMAALNQSFPGFPGQHPCLPACQHREVEAQLPISQVASRPELAALQAAWSATRWDRNKQGTHQLQRTEIPGTLGFQNKQFCVKDWQVPLGY